MKTKKLLAALLSSAMVLGTMAVPVFAADATVTDANAFKSAVAAGGTVELEADITLTDCLMVGKDLTIIGNGHKVTSSANRILRVDSSNTVLTLKNISFISTAPSDSTYPRGLQVDSDMTNVTLNMTDVHVSNVTHYAINLGPRSTVKLTANNCSFSAWAAFNIWSDGFVMDFDNCEFTGTNNNSGSSWNDFGTFVVEGDSTNATTLGASGNTMNLNNCTINAIANGNCSQAAFLFNSNSEGNIINITGDNTKVNVTDYFCLNYGDNNTISISGGDIDQSSPAEDIATLFYSSKKLNTNISGGNFGKCDTLFGGTAGASFEVAVTGGTFADDVQFLLDDGYTERVYKDSYEVKPADTVETTVSTAAITAPVTIKSAIDMNKGDNGTYEQVTAKAVEASALTGGNSDQRVFTVTSTYYDDKGDLQTDFTKNVTLTDILKDIHVSGGGDILCGLIITDIPNGYTVTIE